MLCVLAATRHRVTARAGFIGASAVKLSERAVRSTQYAMRLNGMAFRHKDVHTFDLREALSYRESVDSLWTVCGQSPGSVLSEVCDVTKTVCSTATDTAGSWSEPAGGSQTVNCTDSLNEQNSTFRTHAEPQQFSAVPITVQVAANRRPKFVENNVVNSIVYCVSVCLSQSVFRVSRCCITV